MPVVSEQDSLQVQDIRALIHGLKIFTAKVVNVPHGKRYRNKIGVILLTIEFSRFQVT